MNEGCKLICKHLFSLVELCALHCSLHFLDLLNGEEGKKLQALDNIAVAHVSPVLEELVGRGLFGVKPYSALFGLAHLLALGVCKEGDGHSVSVLCKLLSDKLCAAQHICPLVVAAELHIAAVLPEQHIEIVALHYHVVEFKEGKTSFHSLLVALECKHLVYREASAYLSENVNIVKVKEPVAVVYKNSLVLGKVDESCHLLLEALNIVVDGFGSHHFSHIGLARGVAYHCGAAADKHDRLVSCHLKSFHKAKRHKVTNVKAVRCGVKADVEGSLSVVYHLADFLFIGYLSDKPSSGKFFV